MRLKKATKGGGGRMEQTQKFQVEQLETTIYAHFIYTLYSRKHNNIIYNANVFKLYSNFVHTSREVFHSNVCTTAVGQ